eukprot:Pompholyxophrys_punicea_v1_NODE_585_length_1648_cov_2.561833.p3 type:complete len:101 gc:universal NODE_585_length_1648_cov_2.561833:948-646(-)
MNVYSQILKLQPTVTEVFACHHLFWNTMFDGKSVNAILNIRSNSTCNVCKLPPSQLNNFEKIGSTSDSFALLFGFSPLHVRIRFLEYVLNVTAKIDMKIG